MQPVEAVRSVHLRDAAATEALGAALGQVILAGTVLLLSGDLGSGKTTFVQGLGAALGVSDPIVSPTFALIHEYLEARIPLYHFDLYRLQREEATALYLEAYWDGDYPAGIVAIEWAERLTYLPSEYLAIRLSWLDSTVEEVAAEAMPDLNGGSTAELGQTAGRSAQFEAIGELPQQLLQALSERLGSEQLERAAD